MKRLDQIPELNTINIEGKIIFNFLKNPKKYFSFSIEPYVIVNQYVKKREDTADLTV